MFSGYADAGRRAAAIDIRLGGRRLPAYFSMSANTIADNRRMRRFDDRTEVWLFGYGSLIYKADFPYLQRRPAHIRDWARRFWQGSHDHRGTADAPGRVVTLIPERGTLCMGMAYLITPQVFEHLDHREKNGYLRCATDVFLAHGSRVDGLVYIAMAENAAFLGPAPEHEIARHIAHSHGPSGANRDYLIDLAAALRELDADDAHVFAIERHLQELIDTDRHEDDGNGATADAPTSAR